MLDVYYVYGGDDDGIETQDVWVVIELWDVGF
jgi:hypothetical protein